MTFSTPASARAEPLLAVEALSVGAGPGMPLIEDLSFSVNPGETLAIVGESGCGKSLTSLAVMGLLPPELRRHQKGAIRFRGRNLPDLPPRQLRALRGNEIAMIFQEPLTALNPVMTVGAQIMEVLTAHSRLDRDAARRRVVDLLDKVRLPDPEARVREYPHRLSGGMRQRVTIAMAIACEPALIIADEPTTALDVTVQAQILDLLSDLHARSGNSLILITHDLGVVDQIADRMVVMYAGSLVEAGPVAEVLRSPRHPYTAGLLAARPRGSFVHGGQPLQEIPGRVPAPDQRPPGCLFAPRCPRATRTCTATRPPVEDFADGRSLRCFHPLGVA